MIPRDAAPRVVAGDETKSASAKRGTHASSCVPSLAMAVRIKRPRVIAGRAVERERNAGDGSIRAIYRRTRSVESVDTKVVGHIERFPIS